MTNKYSKIYIIRHSATHDLSCALRMSIKIAMDAELIYSLGDHVQLEAILPEENLLLLRKEVIQPHLPVRLPCYDLVPVTNHTFADALLAVRQPTSGTTNFGDLTGGVYKTRERIHPIVADTGLLTIPASCRRVAACNLNWGRL